MERNPTASKGVTLDELLGAFPKDGGWMPGSGRYSKYLTELLDDGTKLIEEELIADEEGQLSDWLVRLTALGLIERAALRPDWRS